jgi:cysteinyl-tRNA synthetase
LSADAQRIEAEFQAALARRDIDGCVEAILALEQALLDWSADTNVSDEAEQARAKLRAMVVSLGELATRGARDPRSVVAPYVDTLLELRARARSAKDFATSDWVRDQLIAASIEVRDTPAGVEWDLA